MKIAHVNMIFSKGNMHGVEKKLSNEAYFMEKNNIDVYVLNREKDGYSNNINYINIEKNQNINILYELKIRMFKYFVIDKFLDVNKYDYIILRYNFVDFSAFSFSKKYKNKIFTEHHTIELEELKVQNIKEPFKTIQYYLEKYFSKYFFFNNQGLISVTSEILDTVLLRCKNKDLKTHVLSNGLNHLSRKSFLKKDISEIDLLFVSSVFKEWHGLDRLINSLEKYSGLKKLNVHIVGKLSFLQERELLDIGNKLINIKIHGILDSHSLTELYKRINIACDSLAMYRLKMNESSTLKSKEYILNFIPFLYSTYDPDYDTLSDYLFKINNDDSIINLNEVIDKYLKLDQVKMYQVFSNEINNKLSWDYKIKNLKNWIISA